MLATWSEDEDLAPARGRALPHQEHAQHLVRPLPGAMRARPDQATPIANLFFAGDWTQQPFFGSQEGAVRGGKACGEKLLDRFGELPEEMWRETVARERAAREAAARDSDRPRPSP